MSPEIIGAIGLVVMILLVVLRVPVALAMPVLVHLVSLPLSQAHHSPLPLP